jgi:hypothetical protein
MEAGVVVAYTYLEAVDGEEAAEDALLEPRAQHDHVVLHVHGARVGAAGVALDRPVEKNDGGTREGGKCGSLTPSASGQRESVRTDRAGEEEEEGGKGKGEETDGTPRRGYSIRRQKSQTARLGRPRAAAAFLGLEASFLRTWHRGR